jgi:hypothetical protein
MRAPPSLAVLPLGTLLLLAACEPDKKVLPRVAATDAAFVTTGFEACDEEAVSNPNPRSVSGAGLATLLHGTWVAHRTVRDGKSMYPQLVPGNEPNAHHILVLDTKAGVGLQYEERGTSVASNAFAQILPAPDGAPGMTYLYCGGKEFSAFRDRYVKVSNDPADGLRALAQVTGQPVGGGSIGAAWQTLRDAGFLTGSRNGNLITAALYSVTTGQVQRPGTQLTDARWDMVGEYRGSPAKFAQGQPSTGMEGGVFQGVTTAQGSYFVGGDVMVSCYGLAATAEPAAETYQQSPIIYDRIVIGPFN